jgi:lipoprotein-releasing system permease protein
VLSFEFFYRFLLSKRAGSLVKSIARICIVGVWLGVTSLIVVVSVMNGFNQSIQERLLEVEPHLNLQFKNKQSLEEMASHPVNDRLREAGVKLISPVSQKDVIMRTEEGFIQHAVAFAVTRERLQHLLDYADKKNKRSDAELSKKIAKLGRGDIVLGMGLADSIGLFYDNHVTLMRPEYLLMPSSEWTQFSQAQVKGFLATDVERIDGHSLYYLIDQPIPGLEGSASEQLGMEVWLNDPQQAGLLKKQLASEDVEIETWQERNSSLFFALKVEKFVVSFLVSLSTLIAGLSIVSVMVLLLTQKKKDVGHLLTLGMTRRRVMNLFINIGLFLSLSGVVAGVLTGVGASFFIDTFSKDVLPTFYEDTNIPAEVRFQQIFLIIFVSISLSYLALRLTMNKLSSFQPSEIMRG